MESKSRDHQPPHIYFLPVMAPGHMIPMIDIARKFSRHGAKSTIITTSSNASLFSQTLQSDRQNYASDISLSLIQFPCREAGLPDGCENLSSTTTPQMSLHFLLALDLLRQPVDDILRQGDPDCIISSAFFPWTTAIAAELKIPRVVFYGTGFLPMCIIRVLRQERPQDDVVSDSEEFQIPGLPGELRLSRLQLPQYLKLQNDDESDPILKITKRALEADEAGFGIIVNTFFELEPAYACYYRETIGRKAWHIGPISLINKTDAEKNHRGREARDCLSWLNAKKPNSVVYICFGSMAILQTPQLHEIAAALESSGQNFVWVIGNKIEDDNGGVDLLPRGFEERTEGRGLIVRGWAPQVQILDHEAVGGFVTHCGWNSLLEGVAAGVPMVTWPLSEEQFFNEKLVVEITRTGISVGAEECTKRTDEREAIKREKIEKAVVELMVGEGGERMRRRARELGDLARRAVEEGGSSDADFNCFMEEIRMFRA